MFVDGLTAIQSAMDSRSYQNKMKDRFWQMREHTDLACQSLQGNQVNTFYDKYEQQDILQSERLLLERVRRADTHVAHHKDLREYQEGSFWNPHAGITTKVKLTKGPRKSGIRRVDTRYEGYVQNISANRILDEAQSAEAFETATVQTHDDLESGPLPKSWAAPNARHERVNPGGSRGWGAMKGR